MVPVEANAFFRRAFLILRGFSSVFGSCCWYLSEASCAINSGWDSINLPSSSENCSPATRGLIRLVESSWCKGPVLSLNALLITDHSL